MVVGVIVVDVIVVHVVVDVVEKWMSSGCSKIFNLRCNKIGYTK